MSIVCAFLGLFAVGCALAAVALTTLALLITLMLVAMGSAASSLLVALQRRSVLDGVRVYLAINFMLAGAFAGGVMMAWAGAFDSATDLVSGAAVGAAAGLGATLLADVAIRQLCRFLGEVRRSRRGTDLTKDCG